MKACAYIVGPPDGPGAALQDMARGLGFAAVLPYAGAAAAEAQSQQIPLLFLLFTEVDDVLALKPIADAIRFSPSRRIRFSPLIYFAESPAREAIASCIEMGFDDVITMPFTRKRVQSRMGRLVDHTQVYFETPVYLGPDRRVSLAAEIRPGQYRRLEIMRSPLTGVNVMRDDAYHATP